MYDGVVEQGIISGFLSELDVLPMWNLQPQQVCATIGSKNDLSTF